MQNPTDRWAYSAPLVCAGQLIAGVSSHLTALDAVDGTPRWSRHDLGCEDWISSYPSPASDGRVVAVAFYSQPSSLVVLDFDTGETLRQRDGIKENYIYATPVIYDDMLFTVSGSAIRALTLSTGELVWECPISLQRIQATPALVTRDQAADRLVISTGQGQVLAVDATSGEVIWTWQTKTTVPLFTPYLRTGPTTLGSPTIVGECAWIPGADGSLYALSVETGALLWTIELGTPLGAPPIASGSGLWIGASDGTVVGLTSAT